MCFDPTINLSVGDRVGKSSIIQVSMGAVRSEVVRMNDHPGMGDGEAQIYAWRIMNRCKTNASWKK